MRIKVLVAFQGLIGTFLTPREHRSLAHASKWLRVPYEVPRDAPKRVATTGLFFLFLSPDEFAAKVQELHASLVHRYRRVQNNGGASRNNSKKFKRRQHGTTAMINAANLSVVMRDLVLVAMGIRASCLVDCCALERPFVTLLLETLMASASNVFGCTFGHVYVVILQENVFFVHAQRFLQQKCVDVASALSNLSVVNVSAHLQHPQVITPASIDNTGSVQGTRARAIVQVIETICDQLVELVVDSSSSSNRILEVKEARISTTALAGILLCYPVIYDLYDPSSASLEAGGGDGDGGGWDVQENCLGMCPLFVLQTSILHIRVDGLPPSQPDRPASAIPTIVLQEFSIPQCVLECSSESSAAACDSNTSIPHDDAMSRPPTPLSTLALLKARCKIQIAHALRTTAARQEASSSSNTAGGANFHAPDTADSGGFLPGVHVAARTLDRVAL